MSRQLVGHVELCRLVSNMYLEIITALETRMKIYLNSQSELYRLWHGRVAYFGSRMYVTSTSLYALLFTDLTIYYPTYDCLEFVSLYISSDIQNYEIFVYTLVTNEQNNDTK